MKIQFSHCCDISITCKCKNSHRDCKLSLYVLKKGNFYIPIIWTFHFRNKVNVVPYVNTSTTLYAKQLKCMLHEKWGANIEHVVGNPLEIPRAHTAYAAAGAEAPILAIARRGPALASSITWRRR